MSTVDLQKCLPITWTIVWEVIGFVSMNDHVCQEQQFWKDPPTEQSACAILSLPIENKRERIDTESLNCIIVCKPLER